MAEDPGQSAQKEAPDAGQAAKDASSDSTTEPLEGKVEAEKAGYVAELVAYRVIDNLGLVIANRVDTALKNREHTETARILLVDDLEQTVGGLALTEIKAQTKLLRIVFDQRETQHKELLEPTGAPTRALASQPGHMEALLFSIPEIAAAAATVVPQFAKAAGAAIDVLAYFRSNYKVSAREMSVAKQALLYSTAGNLTGRGLTAFIPGFYRAKNSPLLSTLTRLAHQAACLKTERDYLAEELPKKSAAAGGDGQGESQGVPNDASADDSPDKERLARVEKAVRETDAALLAYEGFRTAWMMLPETTAKDEGGSAGNLAVMSGTDRPTNLDGFAAGYAE